MPTVTVGPVIGKVDHDSARILVEVDTRGEITCVARPVGGGEDVAQTLVVGAGRATVFELSGLLPATQYRLRLQEATCPVPSRFRTLATDPDALDCIVVADNYGPHPRAADPWDDIWRRYIQPEGAGIDLVVHAGNQIIGDSAFRHALALLGGKTRGTERVEARVLEIYRDLYRTAWRHLPTRHVLANVSNLMIWNDLEIRRGWGGHPHDRDPERAEHWVGGLARRVYREYQRQLWDPCDTDATPISGFEHHVHRLGATALVFLDLRGGRSFETDPARPYLGTPQWERLQYALGEDGDLESARALVLVAPLPLGLLGGDPPGWVDDLADHWSYRDHRREQVELLRALRRWKQRDPARAVLAIGGGVAVAGVSELRFNGEAFMPQVLVPPITAHPMSQLAFEGLTARLGGGPQRIGTRYECRHGELTRMRGYGVVLVRAPEGGPSTITAELESEPTG